MIFCTITVLLLHICASRMHLLFAKSLRGRAVKVLARLYVCFVLPVEYIGSFILIIVFVLEVTVQTTKQCIGVPRVDRLQIMNY